MSAPNTILIPTSTVSDAIRRRLPDSSANIFTRLIRNPLSISSSPRERQCAEMLASLLINCPNLCQYLFAHLLLLGEYKVPLEQISRWDIETEQAIGPKRDDLRIRGWEKDGFSEKLLVLWTVEIKVGADFHVSSVYDGGESSNDETVNQLLNYDRWLSKQSAPIKGGFVLALVNLSAELPRGLASNWRCLTWTELGVVLKAFLDQPQLPLDERFLCRHVLGFIVGYLWRSAEMPDARIEFDDVALLRAMSKMGQDCKKKVERLVEPLGSLFETVGIGKGKWQSQKKSLFGEFGIYCVWRPFIEGLDRPNIGAGVESENFAVWVETDPGYSKKEAIRSLLPSLKARNPNWEALTDSKWWDLYLSMPLIQLVAAKDQSKAVEKFVTEALGDLAAVDIAKVITK